MKIIMIETLFKKKLEINNFYNRNAKWFDDKKVESIINQKYSYKKLDSLNGIAKVFIDNTPNLDCLRESIEIDCRNSINDILTNCFTRRGNKKN